MSLDRSGTGREMATAKSSRSRASGHSGMLQANGVVGNAVSAADSVVQLTDMLQIFKSDNFDPDGYVQSKCQTMSEKVMGPSLPIFDLVFLHLGAFSRSELVRYPFTFSWALNVHGLFSFPLFFLFNFL